VAAAASAAAVTPLFSITGEEPLAEFGASLATSGEWCAVGSPAAGAKDNASLRAGEVRLLNLTLALAQGNSRTSEVPTAALLQAGGDGLLAPSLKRSRFGRTLVFADVDGDGRLDLLYGNYGKANELLFGAGGRGGFVAAPSGSLATRRSRVKFQKHK
jgi:hypothetical protein